MISLTEALLIGLFLSVFMPLLWVSIHSKFEGLKRTKKQGGGNG